ncbi:acyl-CoA dehydrogenase [Rhodococcus triatomae]|uniref:Acyl-CoA dehydrogenase n=1 Tax=Rhodococcus triatomae TaxID=300028 RepID=A0A1G8MQE6_9NOCA|nr:acyl-CoA dehydrogenase family protein [Rhodococcus triatomae]QNG19058.1 acyl-CoA dehydrogenase [Rhodococcus triatomae]QNG25029.1 acyl-CoA dehydrogenase [Rhodococcus triatomae]SDI70134.1 Acyl-CoA dehydrogenase [Rhodococcus triatomae]
MNFTHRDPALHAVLDRWIAPSDRALLDPLLDRLGADAAGRLDTLAATADKNPPTLEQFDRDGTRVDRIAYHPAYLELCRAAYSEYGLSALSHRAGLHGWDTVPPHLVKYLASYVFVQAEFGLACPVSMTDAAARTLRMFGDPEVFAPWIDALSSTDPDRSMTGAMFMTEIQAGTDIARTETQAVPDSDGTGWRLTGRKWFASNPDADVVVTLARFPGGAPGSTRGVGMFMVPRTLGNGDHNAYTIDRLKDKMGTRSMPSGEVTLHGAYALQVGDLDRGFRQMAEMVNTSRLSNAMRSAALMRRAVREAVDHVRSREVFGKRLFDQPLMRATLLPLALDAEAALALVAYSSTRLQAADAGDPEARSLVRILTPVAKHHVCKRARSVTGESMEIRGGNGYIEDWVSARLLRDAHLGSIWEGSSNVIALDVLRCMRKADGHRTLAGAMRTVLAALGDDCADGRDELAHRWDVLEERGDRMLSGDDDVAQAECARYTDDLARTTMATLLYDLADDALARGAGHRSLLVAHAYLTGIAGQPCRVATTHLDAVVDGTDVSRDAASAASPRALTTTGALR